MGSIRDTMLEADSNYRIQSAYSTQWPTTRSPNGYNDGYQNGGYDIVRDSYRPPSTHVARNNSSTSPFGLPSVSSNLSAFHSTPRTDQYPYSPPPSYGWQQATYQSPPCNGYGPIGSTVPSYTTANSTNGASGANGSAAAFHNYRMDDDLSGHDILANSVPLLSNDEGMDRPSLHGHRQSSFSPTGSADDVTTVSPSVSDLSMDGGYDKSPPLPGQPGSAVHDAATAFLNSVTVNGIPGVGSFVASSVVSTTPVNGTSANGAVGTPVGNTNNMNNMNNNNMHEAGGRSRPPRRGGNRDEFDGPHQLLPRPPPQYIAQQERELPHLPTHLHVEEQDHVLSQVNDRLSQCAYDFVARYQFPIPLTQDMRRVSRPQDREWTEWVQLLKRLATKRRIPARVLYNNQIKQFVTILENSLEMRHAARHQSRPLKDDRNILQLISAGIQVAKILKDAPAMVSLDRLYVDTDRKIQERSAATAARFRT